MPAAGDGGGRGVVASLQVDALQAEAAALQARLEQLAAQCTAVKEALTGEVTVPMPNR